MPPPTSRSLAATAAIIFGLSGAPAAVAGDISVDARHVIQTMWESVVPILTTKGLDKAARERGFAAVYRAHFDNPGIAAAVTGPAWRQATAEQRAEFLRLFEAYVVKIYAGQFATYKDKGGQLLIQSSQPDGDGAMVTTQIVDPAASSGRSVEIKWRLRMTAEGLRVRDVVFENISMTLTHRREFAAVMQQRGGTLDGLLAALREKFAE